MVDLKKFLNFTGLNLIALFSLLLQLHGLIILWKMNQKRLQDIMVVLNLKKRNYHLQKLKLIRYRRLCRRKRRCWNIRGRTDEWWCKMINGESPSDNWKKNFRFSKVAFMNLVDELRPYITPSPLSPNRRALSAEKKLAITLYYLKDTGSLNMTANTFGVAICTVSSVIYQVCSAISTYLGPKYLHLPRNTDEMRQKIAEFEAKFGFRQAFGCIDGSHVPILCPSENSQDYFCYKQFHSLNVQAVCDYRGMFMDVECRWPGSVHDAKVFANSAISSKLRNEILPKTFQTLLPGEEKIPNYLIGDPAYPLTPYCIKEYDHCSNDEQVIFNSMLRSARNPIECAFGRLKARWGILTRKMDLKLKTVPIVIYSCFVLHNICEENNIYIDDGLVNTQINCIKSNEEAHRNIPDPIFSCDSGEGKVARNILTKFIKKHL